MLLDSGLAGLAAAAGPTTAQAAGNGTRHAPVRIDEPPPGKAVIVFFRKGQFADILVGLSVKEGKTKLGPLDYDTYLVLTVEPGLHTYTVGYSSLPMQIVVEPGEIYYVRCTPDNDIVSEGQPSITPAEERQFDDVSWRLKPAVPYSTAATQDK